MAKLVKSIYTGSDVTALGELTSSDTIEGDITFAADVDVTGVAKGTVDPQNTMPFDLTVANMFTCTPTAAIDLSFTLAASNGSAGVSGLIYLSNASNYTVTAAADVHISAADLTALSATGNYIVTFYCPDGTNVYLSASAALTEGS